MATKLLGQIVDKLFGSKHLLKGSVGYFFWPRGAVNREILGVAGLRDIFTIKASLSAGIMDGFIPLLASQPSVDLSLFENFASIRFPILKASQQNIFLWGRVAGRTPNPQPEGLSGMRVRTSSHVTADRALRIILPTKTHHYVKVEIPSGQRRSGGGIVYFHQSLTDVVTINL